MFIQMVSSKPPSILLPNLVLWCIIMSWIVNQNFFFWSYGQNMTLSTITSELLILWQPNFVWWYSIISQSVLWKNGLLCLRARSQWRFKMSVNVQIIFSKLPNILLPNLVWHCIIMSQSFTQKSYRVCLLLSRSGSQQGLIWSKYGSF